EIGDLPRRRPPLGVIPGQHQTVLLSDREGARTELGRSLAPVGTRAPAPRLEAEAVEGTAQRLALHPAAVAQVSSEVRTVRVDEAELARRGAEQDPLLTHEGEGPDLARGEVRCGADAEPAGGEGEGEGRSHGGARLTRSRRRGPAALRAPRRRR